MVGRSTMTLFVILLFISLVIFFKFNALMDLIKGRKPSSNGIDVKALMASSTHERKHCADCDILIDFKENGDDLRYLIYLKFNDDHDWRSDADNVVINECISVDKSEAGNAIVKCDTNIEDDDAQPDKCYANMPANKRKGCDVEEWCHLHWPAITRSGCKHTIKEYHIRKNCNPKDWMTDKWLKDQKWDPTPSKSDTELCKRNGYYELIIDYYYSTTPNADKEWNKLVFKIGNLGGITEVRKYWNWNSNRKRYNNDRDSDKKGNEFVAFLKGTSQDFNRLTHKI